MAAIIVFIVMFMVLVVGRRRRWRRRRCVGCVLCCDICSRNRYCLKSPTTAPRPARWCNGRRAKGQLVDTFDSRDDRVLLGTTATGTEAEGGADPIPILALFGFGFCWLAGLRWSDNGGKNCGDNEAKRWKWREAHRRRWREEICGEIWRWKIWKK